MLAPRRILVLGCGSVAQCTLPLLLRELDLPPSAYTVIDMIDNRERIADSLERGVSYHFEHVTRENLDDVLGRYAAAGDILLDVAWNIDCNTILEWCRDHGVRYLNTSVEMWDPYEDAAETHPLDRTLYVRHMRIRDMIARWPDNKGPSAVVEHGANPGLVSHFTKQALEEVAGRALSDGLVAEHRSVEVALAEKRYAALAHLLGVKVIHISERDTQITDRPKEVDEFCNTWSVEGFYEEGVAPAEMGWGTHERRLPPNAYVHAGKGPGNQICLGQMAFKTWVRSRVPSCEIIGMVIRHGEAFTISDHLTVWDADGTPVYRPTVHYAYCPADVAMLSMIELEMRQWRMQPRQRILNDEIISGRDELGVLLMGHPYQCWWTGSLLSIEEARALVPHQNATTLQVAASVLGAVRWMIERPEEGVRVPDELPWEDVMKAAYPYLGTCWSGPIEWDPVSTRINSFDTWSGRYVDRDDPWQYANFQL